MLSFQAYFIAQPTKRFKIVTMLHLTNSNESVNLIKYSITIVHFNLKAGPLSSLFHIDDSFP